MTTNDASTLLVLAATARAAERLHARLAPLAACARRWANDEPLETAATTVILDLMTPGIDAATLCQQIRRLPGAATISILGIVQDHAALDVSAWVEAGIEDFASASNSNALLRARVESLQRRASKLRAAEEAMPAHAHDPLTQLPSHAVLLDHAEACVSRAKNVGQRAAVFSIDLDGFKRVNDCFGQAAGDRVLQESARRFAACVRGLAGYATVLTRSAGDEFHVLAPGVDTEEDAKALAQRIVDSASAPISLQGYEVVITASVGAAWVDATTSDAGEAVRHADAAMHLAKQRGKNGFRMFAPACSLQRRDRLLLEDDLRRAIERDELELHYQPKVDARSQSVLGCEALVRWHRGAAGYLPPLEFIPVAEESGLIIPLGDWVMRRALQDGVVLHRELDRRIKMAVNVSSCQFKDPRFVGKVEALLAETGMAADDVEIEITEGTLMEDALDAEGVLRSLKELGLSIALDDFGTGYSSLSYLRRFAIDVLKIDRSFVRDLADDEDGAAIVEAILALAQRLRLRVVAEGVEDAAQLGILARLACDEIQGYYFSKPLPRADFVAWCRSRSGPRASLRPRRSEASALASGAP